MAEGLRTIDGLRYHLLPGRLIGADSRLLALHDATFAFWKTFWSEVYKSVGESGDLDAADFYRQDVIGALFDGDRVVALHAYTLFDVRSLAAREHSYFRRHFHETALAALARQNVYYLMTMEYIAVAPDWRASRTGISLASILVGLGLQVAQTLEVDGSISSARADNGADKIAKGFGAETLATVTVHQKATDLILFPPSRVHPHASADVNRWIERFWAARSDWTAILAPRRRQATAA